MFKKKLATLLTLVLLLTLLSPVSVKAVTFQDATNEAVNICVNINMLLGSGSGVTPAYLASTPQRYQGAILLLRLMGLYDASLLYNYTTSYNDTNTFTWVAGRKILGYLFEHQSTIGFKGYPDGNFNPYGNMDAKQYYKVMLVALGYVENVDFAWDTTSTLPGTLEKAQQLGMTWLLSDTAFTISDLAVATVEALRTPMKGTSVTLAQHLIDLGIIDATVAASVNLISAPSIPSPNPSASLSIILGYETAVSLGDTMISISLTDATFKSTIGSNNAETTALIDSITGSLSTPSSWNSSINLTSNQITRLSDTAVLINLPSSSEYLIGSNESITINLPPSVFNESVSASVPAGSVTIVDVGSGTTTDPFGILRPEDFEFISRYPSLHYALVQDLDFSGKLLYETDVFAGTFDGNNYTISNLSLNPTDNMGSGLFNTLNGATISDLVIQSSTITGLNHSNIGFIAGIASTSTLSSVYVKDSIITKAGTSGLLIGYADGSMQFGSCGVSDSSITNVLSNTLSKIGGILGHSDLSGSESLTIIDTSLSNVTLGGSTSSNVGGFVGFVSGNASLSNCKFNGALVGDGYVGGILGYGNINSGSSTLSVTSCSTYGTLNGRIYLGGIVGGSNNAITLTSNYAGLTSITVTEADPSVQYVHRILGRDSSSSATLSNTAYTFMKLYNNTGIESSSTFVSDKLGLDGENYTPLIFIPMPFEIFIPEPVLVNPWEIDWGISLDDLIIEDFPFPFPGL